MKHLITLFAASLLTSVCYAQTHKPSHTIEGTIITIDAEVASISPDPKQLLSGVRLADDSLAVASPGSPIVWKLKPGTYQLRMMGFPDDPANPQRSVVDVDVKVKLTRKEAVLDAYDRCIRAMSDLHILSPTYEDLLDSLSGSDVISESD